MATTRKNWHAIHISELTFGQRVADLVAATMGSWTFIITESVVLDHPVGSARRLDSGQRHRVDKPLGPVPIHASRPCSGNWWRSR